MVVVSNSTSLVELSGTPWVTVTMTTKVDVEVEVLEGVVAGGTTTTTVDVTITGDPVTVSVTTDVKPEDSS